MNDAPGYAVGYLREVDVNDEIMSYIERIEATLAPFGGHFLVHGGDLTPAEGEWDGDLVIIGFPDLATAREWYDSPGYREILPLRTRNSEGIVALVEGVPNGYRAIDKLATLLDTAR